ncbi:hypothetical protein Plec18167_006384 [Paecilomyces lecythidis]|uniref:HTH APSES-type domain-containing protein n=1 Tax=Paecilomyces lecythidis TaxID=3004212 RepID=A0ABR3XBZ6_9EURO
MASIESLLNPLPELGHIQLPSPSLTSYTRGNPSPTPRAKKQKVAKDAPIFTRGKTRGEVRYPPCEEQDEVLAEEHRRFEIHPMGHIAEYPRHIPYNSEKKSFQEKTGRESFEGYWMPFEAAKAVAATFCWKIRYALTPLFGRDFPSQCVLPEDRERFGRMIIDSSVVRRATNEANYYRSLEEGLANDCIPRLPPSGSPGPSQQEGVCKVSQSRSIRRSREVNPYHVDTDGNDQYHSSPTTSPASHYGNSFTPVNRPQSQGARRDKLPSPRRLLVSMSNISSVDEASDESEAEKESVGSPNDCSTPKARAPTAVAMGDTDDNDEDYIETEDESLSSRASSDSGIETPRAQCRPRTPFMREVNAAHALLTLHLQDAALIDESGDSEHLRRCPRSNEKMRHDAKRKRRRASA